MKIPRQIHYCWFGRNPLPELAKKCIESWRKYMPEYQIIEWNEDNFDVDSIPYTSEAYKEKKFAFVSDYARLWIMYKYGGVYFDTDVEVIKPIDKIISIGAFMGCERDGDDPFNIAVNPGLGLAADAGMPIYKELVELYEGLSFYDSKKSIDYTTIVQITTSVLMKHGLKNITSIQQVAGLQIYPKEYFNPMSGNTIITTENTYSIHHYAGSWVPRTKKIESAIKQLCYNLMGVKTCRKLKRWWKKSL